MTEENETKIQKLYKRLVEECLNKEQGYSTTPEQREENRKRLLREFGKEKFK